MIKHMKKILSVLIFFMNLAVVNAQSLTETIYITEDHSAIFEKIILTDTVLILITKNGAMFNDFDQLVPFLQIEEEAALRNINLKIKDVHLDTILTEMIEEKATSQEILQKIKILVPGVSAEVDKTGRATIIISGIEHSLQNKDLRIRWNGYEFFNAELSDEHLVYQGIDYTLSEP